MVGLCLFFLGGLGREKEIEREREREEKKGKDMYTRMGSLGGPWDTQLLECLEDITLCCTVLFFPGCMLAHQKSVLTYTECSPGDAALMCLCLPCCIYSTRNDIKAKYGILDEPCFDCAATFCCASCAIAQQHRQMRLHGDTPGGPCMK